MTEQEKYMKAALRLAHKAADEGEVPVGAVVVCEGKIVGRGRNRRETKKDALHHAEIEAIGKACKKLGGWRLHKCDLYVTRVLRRARPQGRLLRYTGQPVRAAL